MSTEASPLITTPTTEAKICKPSDSVMVQVFLMIFLAEWGDRSQVSTILLAGTHPVLSVFFGGCVGYFVTSLLAVLGGSFLATKVSPRIVTIAGSVCIKYMTYRRCYVPAFCHPDCIYEVVCSVFSQTIQTIRIKHSPSSLRKPLILRAWLRKHRLEHYGRLNHQPDSACATCTQQ